MSRPRRRRAVHAVVTAALVLSALALPPVVAAQAAPPVPPTPSGLPAAVEQLQPYVGQAICDPVAKAGVRAFSSLVLNTYRDTGSSGIIRDCGVGGTSEHKEGRAWDWRVSVTNPSHVAEVKALLDWLLATDANGNQFAMARRLGIMYIIWNRQIWKAYATDKGWQPYSGASAHTDHVHFSFGWNGARQTTSYWSKKVAPVDYGPAGQGKPAMGYFDALTTSSTATRAVGWAADPETYQSTDIVVSTGGTTRRVKADVRRPDIGKAYPELGELHGFSVDLSSLPDGEHEVCVTSLNYTGTGGADADLGCRTVTLAHGAVGQFDVLSSGPAGTRAVGWAFDHDSPDASSVRLVVDGTPRTAVADVPRPDVATAFPDAGEQRGFEARLDDLADGPHTVCATALNLAGTIGADADLGCRKVVVRHDVLGNADATSPGPTGARVSGWAGDPDADEPLTVLATSGATRLGVVTAERPRPDVQKAYPWMPDVTGYTGLVPLTSLPEGDQPVCLTAPGVGLGKSRDLGCRTVKVRHEPFGDLNLAQRAPGGIRMVGWAIEPDVAGSASVRLSTSYGYVRTLAADLARPDVAKAFPYGQEKGFDAVVPVPSSDGTYRVCADVVDAGPGVDQRLGCRDLVVRHAAVGNLDLASFGPGGLRVQGWSLDPDTDGPVSTHVYVDGAFAGVLTADTARPDIGRAFPLWGPDHGVDGVIARTWSTGSHRVCLWAINAGAGSGNPLLGCQTVTKG